MAVRSTLVTIQTTATVIVDLSSSGDNVSGSGAAVYNDGSVTVYVGGDDVTSSGATKGLPLAPGASIDAEGNEIFYGIVASGTCDVIVLEVGVVAA